MHNPLQVPFRYLLVVPLESHLKVEIQRNEGVVDGHKQQRRIQDEAHEGAGPVIANGEGAVGLVLWQEETVDQIGYAQYQIADGDHEQYSVIHLCAIFVQQEDDRGGADDG